MIQIPYAFITTHHKVIKCVLAFLLFISAFSARTWEPLQRLQLFSTDFFMRLRRQTPADPSLLLIRIDSTDSSKIGAWPWDRSWFAKAVLALHEFGARHIYIDVPFPVPAAVTEEDTQLIDAVVTAGNVYIPYSLSTISTPEQSHPPFEQLHRALKGSGPRDIIADCDGITRTLPLLFSRGTSRVPHIILQLFLDALDMRFIETDRHHFTIGNAHRTIRLPVTLTQRLRVNWLNAWPHGIRHIAFSELLEGYFARQSKTKTSFDPEIIRGKICVITPLMPEELNPTPTPRSPDAPRVYTYISALNTLLLNVALRPVAPVFTMLVLLFCSFLPTALFTQRQLWRELSCLIIALVIVLAAYILIHFHMILDAALPLIVLLISNTGTSFLHQIHLTAQRRSIIQLAATDELTGLYNKRFFNGWLAQERVLAIQDPLQTFALLMLDIDNFKRANDTYGHQAGDLILSQVAKVLRISVRTSDVIARYGGEEIVIVLRGTMVLDDALSIAEQIRANIEQHITRNKEAIYRVTVSIGVAIFRAGESTQSLLKRADQGLYAAKNSGRNKVCSMESLETGASV